MRTTSRKVEVTRHHVPVLLYHSVSVDASPRFRPYVISPRLFRQHLSMLTAEGFRAVTMADHARLLARGEPAARTVVITFDDGFADFHSCALPVLAEFGLAATVYVPTAFVGQTSRWLAPEGEDTRPMMSWSALAEVASTGIEVGSHSRTHADLDLAPAPVLSAEVVGSKRELEDELQDAVQSFAYPFGHHNAAVRDAVARAGYTSAAAVRDLSSGTEGLLRVRRWTIRGDMSTPALRRLVTTRSGPLAVAKSDAHALISTGLRQIGLKRRPPVEMGRSAK